LNHLEISSPKDDADPQAHLLSASPTPPRPYHPHPHPIRCSSALDHQQCAKRAKRNVAGPQPKKYKCCLSLHWRWGKGVKGIAAATCWLPT